MDGVKESFLAGLERDESGFLLRYLAAEERPRRGGDSRGMLEECWEYLQEGEFQPAQFVQAVLEILILEPKVHPKAVYDLLWDWARDLGGEQVFHGVRAFKARFQALQDLLSTPRGMEYPFRQEDLEQLHEELGYALLRREADSFLYDLRERKKDRTLAVLDAYCREKGLGLTGAEWSEDQRRDWEVLFPLLRAGKNIGVLLPVRIDPMTGAGLYVVGKEYYYRIYAPEWIRLRRRKGAPTSRQEEQLALRQRQAVDGAFKGSCCYACFYLHQVTGRDQAPVLVQLGPEEVADDGTPAVCLDLEEALRWFADMTEAGNEAYESFVRRNGPPPEGCPARLSAYFNTLD